MQGDSVLSTLQSMKKIEFNENERLAVSRLKAALGKKLKLVDFRVFGSKARGDSSPESDIDIMIVVENYDPAVETAIDDTVFKINLTHDCFITTLIFGKAELEEGPLSESPIYKAIEKEGVRV